MGVAALGVVTYKGGPELPFKTPRSLDFWISKWQLIYMIQSSDKTRSKIKFHECQQSGIPGQYHLQRLQVNFHNKEMDLCETLLRKHGTINLTCMNFEKSNSFGFQFQSDASA